MTPRGAVVTTDTEPVYRYTSVVSPCHFVSQWNAYASARTDAAHEYHEAAALALLAAATPNVRAHLAPYPNGLPTNLYILIVGDSTTSRKSTSKDFAQDVQYRALPGSLSADHFSPEGFLEQLAGRPHDCMTLYVDEFGELLEKLHHSKHMAGMRGLLLTAYGGNDYVYRRHSKRGRDGAKVEDEDRIEAPHVIVLGATTPAVFDLLTEADVSSGLLPRFAIVMPEHKPPRQPFFVVPETSERERSALVTWLHRLHDWSKATTRLVNIDREALDVIDGFARDLELAARDRNPAASAIVARLVPMAVKVAMLIAAGRPDATGKPGLDVTLDDADAAVTIATRWQRDALTFAGRIGESDFERKVQRCSRLVETKRRVQRRIVAQQCHTEKKTLDAIQDTLADRGLIHVITTPAAGRPTLTEWQWIGA